MKWLPVLILLSLSTTHAGWKTHVIPMDSDSKPGRASIRYAAPSEFGLATFEDALANLQAHGHIDRLEMIVLHGQVVKPGFQQEILEALEKHAPKEFARAQDSAGNMHNPKLAALNEVFDDIVLKTPTIMKIDADLANVGRRVSGAGHEKLTLLREEGELKIFFFLYLSVERS